MHEELKADLSKAHHILHMEGLAEDTYRGHVTARTDDGHVYIKAWAVGFEEVNPGNLVCVDMEGKPVEKQGRLHSELPIHLEIYRRRPETRAVVHIHPYHATMLSALWTGALRVVTQNGMHFADGVPFYDAIELVNSRELGERLAATMGDRFVVLMRNHGIVTAGRTLAEAIILAVDFEKAAREHLFSSLFGTPSEVPANVAEKMSNSIFTQQQYGLMWDFYCRKLARRG